MLLFAIYDKVSKKFNLPFSSENQDSAIRSFVTGVKDSPFASDYELYCIGSFTPDCYEQPFTFVKPDFVCAYSLVVTAHD